MNEPIARIKDYQLITRDGLYPVTVAEVAAQLRLDDDVIAVDTAYIQSLIEAATRVAEQITRRTCVESTFHGYLDVFIDDINYTLRRCPLLSIDSIKYYVSGSYVTIDSADYYTTTSPAFSKVVPTGTWPTNFDDRLQAIQFIFKAGYSPTTIPDDLKQAILMHVSYLYSNRGDCSSSGGSTDVACSLPLYSRNIYQLNKIKYLIQDY